MPQLPTPGKLLILALGGLLFTGLLCAQSSTDADSLAADLRAYTAFIRQHHVNPFGSAGPQAFDSLEAQVLRNLSGRSKEAFVTDIMRLAALVNDEHTMVWPQRTAFLPFRVRVVSEGLVITATDSARSALALHRILSIDGLPVAQVIDRFRPLVKDDNASYFTEFLHWHLDDPAVLMGLGVIDGFTEIPLALLSPSGDTLRTTVPVIVGSAPAMHRPPVLAHMLANSSTANYWSHLDPADRTLYVQYRRCQDDPVRPFAAFTDSLFTLIDSARPQRLIIDLRFNGGGASAVFAPFLRKLRKSYLNDEGRIRVLIGPGVLSSALMNAVDLKRNTSAVFVGQLTGANINHHGELRTLELPYTGLRVTCSTKWWENWKGMAGGLQPDVEIPETWPDLISGHDRALEVARRP